MKVLFTLFTMGLSVVASAQQPAPDLYQYSAKFVCGPMVLTATATPEAAPGRYFSQTNVHNPSRSQTAKFRKYIAVAEPMQKAGKVSDDFDAVLQPREAFQIDCNDIAALLKLPPNTYADGFAVIESAVELDVDTVYTTGYTTGVAYTVSSIHTERVTPRRMQACRDLKFEITTGKAAWEVVNEQKAHPGEPVLPRPAYVYAGVSPVPGSKWIGAVKNNTDNSPQEWWDFQLCFCLCAGAKDVQLSVTGAAVDDHVRLFLNESPVGDIPWSPGAVPQTVLDPIKQKATPFFKTGQNCLRARLTNINPTLSQFSLAGFVTGANAACP